MHIEAESADRQIPRLEPALEILRLSVVELQAMGVRCASIFGSVACGDAVTASDIDVLVELDPGAHVSLLELVGIEFRLTEIFLRKVDVVSKAGLRPILDDSIVADAVVAF